MVVSICRCLAFAALILACGFCRVGFAAEPAPAVASDAATRQYAAAAALQNREVYDLAIDEWGRFLQLYPQDARVDRALYYRGICHFQTKDYAHAAPDFRRILVDFPKLKQIESCYLYLGLSLFRQGQSSDPKAYAEGAEVLGMLAQRYPEGKLAPQAIFYRGECLYASGRQADAIIEYQRLVDKYPQHALLPEVLYALAIAQAETGQREQAVATLDAFTKQFATHRLAGEVFLRLGELQSALQHPVEAQAAFTAAVAATPFALSDLALLRQAEGFDQQGQLERATKAYATLLERFPKSKYERATRLGLGRCHTRTGQFDAAADALRPLVSGQPDGETAIAAHWLAQGMLKQGQAAAVAAMIEKILPTVAAFPEAVPLQLDLADAVHAIPERRAESVALYRQVAAQPDHPLAARSLYRAALAAHKLGDFEPAAKTADEFLSRYAGDPLEPDARYVAAESDLQRAEYAPATKRYDELLAKFPADKRANPWALRRAWAAYLQNDFANVIAALEPRLAALTDTSHRAEAHYLLGLSHDGLNQWDRALAAYRESWEASHEWRQADEVLLAKSGVEQRLGHGDDAQHTLTELIRTFPRSALLDQAQFQLGECAFAAGDLAAAAVAYARVIDDHPDSPIAASALTALSRTQQKRHEPQAAIDTATRVIDSYPQTAEAVRARYVRAVARYELQQHQAAIEDLTAFLAAATEANQKSDGRYVLALCHTGLGQTAEAAKALETILAEDANYAALDKVCYELAWNYLSQKDTLRAAKTFADLADKFPASPLTAESLYQLGQLRYEQGNFAEAATALQAAGEKAGHNDLGEKTVHKLAWALYRQDLFDQALAAIIRQHATWPQGGLATDARYLQGEILFKQQKFAEALPILQSVERPTNMELRSVALLHAGQAAAQLKEFEKSATLLSQCANEFPESAILPEVLYEHGWALQSLGKLDEAAQRYEQVTAKATGDIAARARFMAGEVCFAKQDHKEAIRNYFNVAYGYDSPTWQAAAQYEAGRCFEVLGKPDQARKSYQEIVDKFPESEKVSLAKERIAALTRG